MPITFKNVPANLRVPLFYAEVDNSQANTAQFLQRTLLIGQKTSAGSAPANVPIKIRMFMRGFTSNAYDVPRGGFSAADAIFDGCELRG
mgnify:CR=1 FL=1